MTEVPNVCVCVFMGAWGEEEHRIPIMEKTRLKRKEVNLSDTKK